MFVYAIPSRLKFRKDCDPGFRTFEIFTDSKIPDIVGKYREIGNMVKGMKHYIADLDENLVSGVLEEDDVLGPYSPALTRNLFRTDRKVPTIMGIVNMTPDSFYSNSRYLENRDLIRKIAAESDIVDIGGESTRPGAEPVETSEEISRVAKAIKEIREYADTPMSIDTYHPETLEKSLKFGVEYINDVSGFRNDAMIQLASSEGLKCIVMHMRGTPRDMMDHTQYGDLIGEVTLFLVGQARKLISNGIEPESIILDPGIGFSKNFESNIDLIKNVESLNAGFRTLYGHSRKKFTSEIIGDDKADRLSATLAVSIYLCEHGVDIIRVHDPKENRQALRTSEFLQGE